MVRNHETAALLLTAEQKPPPDQQPSHSPALPLPLPSPLQTVFQTATMIRVSDEAEVWQAIGACCWDALSE